MSLLVLPLLAVIQVSVLSSFPIMGYTIDLVLIAVVAHSILYSRGPAVRWGLVGGICLDLLSTAPFGTHMLALSIVALFASIRGRDLLHSWAFYPLLAGGLATFLFDLVVILVLAAFRRETGWMAVPLATTLPRALVNALAMAPVFWLSYRRVPRGRTGETRSLGL